MRLGVVTGTELLRALQADGVDLDRFFACAYESDESGGGWLPVLRDVTDPSSDAAIANDPIRIPTVAPAPPAAASEEAQPPRKRRWSFAPLDAPKRRRIDVKLCRRDAPSLAERGASSAPKGELERGSFAALGVVGAKTEENVGTLWRSAYQLGAAFIFTINARYAAQRTDTLRVPSRLPLLHFADWSAFAAAAPHGALLVGVEMGGTPLEEFEHPERAVYVLGSEDTGLPNSVVGACHEVVSISSERYASFNVAMAGSIVLHDRMAKRRLAEKRRRAEASDDAAK